MTQAAGRTVVVVEDDAALRRRLEELLRGAGYRVLAADDALRAVELVRAEEPDLVLTDLEMKGMDGYAVLRALQADPATARCPVLFMADERDFTERVRAFRLGAVEYVAKPFAPETLLRKVERALESRTRRGGESPAAAAPSDSPGLDPPTLPGSSGRLPSFELVPEVLRDVLVVDDNPVFRRFLRDLLSGHGFTVHEATDGQEGLQMALERRPWLILTDVRMPGGDGFEFCRRVRSHSLIRQTPLLFLSGWDDYERRYEGLQLGADDFLSKETTVRELLIRIQLLVKRYSDLGQQRREAGMAGEIEVIGAPGVLQFCHLSRLSGELQAEDTGRHARIRFRDGEVVAAECQGTSGREAVFAFLAWEGGRFEFRPGDPGPGAALGGFEQLLLEGCRLLDERRRPRAEPERPA
jgi:DNA-binding response OmpR family regulator